MYTNLKKKFGQNFLVDTNILNKILRNIKRKNMNILEIGAGDGKLTKLILEKKPKKLTIIEIDKDLIPILLKKFNDDKCITIVNGDILEFSIEERYDLIIGNLPYNISSQILVKFANLKKLPNIMIFMFQKEFALKLLDKKINALNSLLRCFYEINLDFHISKNCFRPIPKVNSSLLTFKKLEKPLLMHEEKENYIKFKRKIFSHKRKQLKNSLTMSNSDLNFDLSKRVEELSLSTFVNLFRKFNF